MAASPTRSGPKGYLTTLQKSDYTPNWWMTWEYPLQAKLEWVVWGDLAGWVDPEDPDVWFLPPLGSDGFELHHPTFAGFPNAVGPNGTFLDHQYIYDAHRFLDLSGGKWKVYRRNIRKYPARTKGELSYQKLILGEREEEVGELLETWAQGRTLQDPDTLVRFVLYGSRRWGLFRDGALVGVNVGDVNYLHAIYRYCVDDGTPYLNEYLRHRFFTSSWTQDRRWVNDGGDLGNPGLARFKRRLNPAVVNDIHSYSRI